MQATFYGHKEIAKYLIEEGADPTLTAMNGCNALDLATLMEESDTELLRMLAGQTIEAAPPAISFNPARAHQIKRSMSTPALGGKVENNRKGFKAWLGKMSNRFRRVKSRELKFQEASSVSINIIPESGEPSPSHVKDNIFVETVQDVSLTKDNLGMENAVFTLGFSAATAELSSYDLAPAAAPPKTRLKSNAINFGIPNGVSVGKILPESGEDGISNSNNTKHITKVKSRKLSYFKSTKEKTEPRKKTKSKKGTLRAILENEGLDNYCDIFQNQEIDLQAFKELNDDDFKELGVREKDRLVMLSVIERLKS